MLHDIAPKKYHVEYFDCDPGLDDIVVLCEGEGIHCFVDNGSAVFPRFGEINSSPGAKYRFLFSIDGERYFMPDVHNEASISVPEKFQRQDCSIFRTVSPRYSAFAAITAQSIYQWYSSRRFCGRCGTGTIHAEAERACICPECGLVEYPKISPVVIVAVTHGEELLVTRYKDRPYRRYALVAGFGEIGESHEDTVRREVFEETGIHVKNLRYYKSQPWGFSSSLLSGFVCDLDGDPEITVDGKELSEALWLTREKIPPADNDIALTAEMMEMFRTGRI